MTYTLKEYDSYALSVWIINMTQTLVAYDLLVRLIRCICMPMTHTLIAYDLSVWLIRCICMTMTHTLIAYDSYCMTHTLLAYDMMSHTHTPYELITHTHTLYDSISSGQLQIFSWSLKGNHWPYQWAWKDRIQDGWGRKVKRQKAASVQQLWNSRTPE